MEYVLTQKGLVSPVVMPIVFQIMLVINIQKEMKPRESKIIVVAWYLLAVISSFVLYICKFDVYTLYIWILTFLLGYPVLYGFEKLGDRLNTDLSVEERVQYEKITGIFRKILGVLVLVFVLIGGVERFIANELDRKVVVLSKVLYIVLGILFLYSGTLKKNGKNNE